MQELGRGGHRQRTKQMFQDGDKYNLPDQNLLELLLFYSIPRRDVKDISYNLINHFGTIENVLNASADELVKVNGIGENTAILINLVKAIYDKVELNRNNQIKCLDSAVLTANYAKNIVGNSPTEKFVVICLNNNLGVIKHHIVSTGTANRTFVEPAKIMEYALNDKASSVVLAHNHPSGECYPSASDINFTLEMQGILEKVGIRLLDHVIVTKTDSRCMTTMADYANYFHTF
jgi:DNA repair protein RadC